jgi:protein-S-isoprenylcysteine O-methyltransferase Ste14
VVSGLYRYVRNPMYIGVITAVGGEALLFGSRHLLVYLAIVWGIMHAFVWFYEEPRLALTHGEEYARFRKNVPRWIPRVRPWRP